MTLSEAIKRNNASSFCPSLHVFLLCRVSYICHPLLQWRSKSSTSRLSHSPVLPPSKNCSPLATILTGFSHLLLPLPLPPNISPRSTSNQPSAIANHVTVWGKCTHCFHMHCILKWIQSEQARDQCPMCRQQWQFK